MNMRCTQSGNARRVAARSKTLLILAALVLFVGLFVQITMLARISHQNKQAAALEKEIMELSANAENLELSINQYHNLDAIEARARLLGMDKPSDTQIRVVNVGRSSFENTSTQTAGLIGGESVLK